MSRAMGLQRVKPLEIQKNIGQGCACWVTFPYGHHVGTDTLAKIRIVAHGFQQQAHNLSRHHVRRRESIGEMECQSAFEGVVVEYG
mmetsp:Transcript_5809/g.6065  ORF Transcript_5809/g.6065 Transcript_5809/m.6065 type:complete len:86 (+) Transcript_5809:613-870(+)